MYSEFSVCLTTKFYFQFRYLFNSDFTAKKIEVPHYTCIFNAWNYWKSWTQLTERCTLIRLGSALRQKHNSSQHHSNSLLTISQYQPAVQTGITLLNVKLSLKDTSTKKCAPTLCSWFKWPNTVGLRQLQSNSKHWKWLVFNCCHVLFSVSRSCSKTNIWSAYIWLSFT